MKRILGIEDVVVINTKEDVELRCEHCFALLSTTDYEYIENNPNGLGQWRDDLAKEHECQCPAVRSWMDDHKETCG